MTFNGSPMPRHACDSPVDTAAEQVRSPAPHCCSWDVLWCPMAVLAVLSYRHVKQQLYRQSEARLAAGQPDPGPGDLRALAAARRHPQEHPPQAILQLAAAKRLPRVAAPVRRPRPKLGNQTQAGSTDGRVAMGGIIIDRTAQGSRRQPVPDRPDRSQPGPDRGAGPARPAAICGRGVRG